MSYKSTTQQNTSSLTDRDVQRELGEIMDGLRNGNDWTKRVDALKNLQQLGLQVKGNQSACLALSQALRNVKEILFEQVTDLRSSVAREACITIQTLANSLGEDFNLLAEGCINVLLKSTYVTIQIVSTSADTCIRKVIESSRNGYVRVIAK
jgi:CLIP-associating protein 1/2